jgi:hypothetical protein
VECEKNHKKDFVYAKNELRREIYPPGGLVGGRVDLI